MQYGDETIITSDGFTDKFSNWYNKLKSVGKAVASTATSVYTKYKKGKKKKNQPKKKTTKKKKKKGKKKRNSTSGGYPTPNDIFLF